jgi:hypothetical protein
MIVRRLLWIAVAEVGFTPSMRGLMLRAVMRRRPYGLENWTPLLEMPVPGVVPE